MARTHNRVGKRHTLVVPKAIRQAVGLKEGDHVSWDVREGRIILEPLPNPWEDLARIVGGGFVKSRDRPAAEKVLLTEVRKRDAGRRH